MAKKSLGQHWLFDKPTLNKIVSAGKVKADDTILEIGPGHGSLTKALLAVGANVVAVEKDPALAEKLKALFSRAVQENKIQVVEGDILDFDLSQLPRNYKVVANIPYYLTSHLVRKLLEAANRPSLIVFLVQKEVAERMAAKAGAMSLLSISVQFYGVPEMVGLVSKTLFVPPPKVDSAIIKITPHARPPFAASNKKFFKLVKIGFSAKRKMLKNNLAAAYGNSQVKYSNILQNVGINEKARAQELSLEQWHKLYEEIY